MGQSRFWRWTVIGLIGSWKPKCYAALRVITGLLFMQHGAQKLFGLLGGSQRGLLTQMGVAGVIEFFGGLLVAVGFHASPIGFLASGEMAVAYFQAHAPQGFWPVQNGGELTVLYCWIFLYIATTGSGVWSIDAMRRRSQ
jgi:putative oxidoreductase